jgi:hypothetical protein
MEREADDSAQIFQDDWDDEDANDEFTQQLREQIEISSRDM